MSNADKVVVSVIIACRNVQSYIAAAIESVRRQSFQSFEIIVIDDLSSDETGHIADGLSKLDARVRVIAGRGVGPAGARNIGIEVAKGEWIAILDGDDLMHLNRLASLLALAADSKADIVADELMAFTDDGNQRDAWLFLGADFPLNREWITLSDLLSSQQDASKESKLGYLKPMIRRDFLRQTMVRYREELIIGEDFDFLARCLMAGATMTFTRLPLYFYRRHAKSISYRLNVKHADLMVDGSEAFQREFSQALPEAERARLVRRHRRLKVQAAAQRLMQALKSGRVGVISRTCVVEPAAAMVVAGFIFEGIQNRAGRWVTSRTNQPAFAHHRLQIVASYKEGPQNVEGEGRVEAVIIDRPLTANSALGNEGLAKILARSLNASGVEIVGTLDRQFLSGYIFQTPTFSVEPYPLATLGGAK